MFDPRLLFVAVVWGMNFSIVKFGLAEFGPLTFTVLRFGAASLLLLLAARAAGVPASIDRRDRLRIAGLGLVGITLYNLLFMEGLTLTAASHSALLISLSPLFAALIQIMTGAERFSVRLASGLALASFGTALVIGRPLTAGSTDFPALVGDLLSLGAAVLWALYTITARPLLERYPALTVTAWSMAAGTLFLLPLALPELATQSWTALSPGSWAAFAFSTVISGSIAFSLWYQGVQRIGVTRTIVYHYLVPLVAVLFAALFLGERITLSQACGGAAIVCGVALVQKRPSGDA